MESSHQRSVSVKKGEPIDRALKRLKSKLDGEGILEEMRRRRAFETPTQRRQRKARTAAKRNKIRWRFVRPDSKKAQEEAAAAAAAGNSPSTPGS